MWQGLGDAVEGFEADPQVRVIVLSGAGDKAFVAGADVSKYEEERMGENAAEHYAHTGEKALSALYNSKQGDHRRDRRLLHRRRHLGRDLLRPAHRDAEVAPSRQPAMRYGIGYRYKSLRRVTDLIGVGRRQGPADRRRDVRRAGSVCEGPGRQGAARRRLHGRGAEAGRQDRRRRAADARAGEVRDRADRAGPGRRATSTKSEQLFQALLCERRLPRRHPRVRREAQAAYSRGVDAHPTRTGGRASPRPEPRAGRAAGGADARRSGRRRDQGRAPGQRRRSAQLRPAVPEGPRRAAAPTPRRSTSPATAARSRSRSTTRRPKASRSSAAWPSRATWCWRTFAPAR